MWLDILIAALAVAVVIGVTVLAIVKKRQGKSIGCDCASCDGNCGRCKSSKPDAEK